MSLVSKFQVMRIKWVWSLNSRKWESKDSGLWIPGNENQKILVSEFQEMILVSEYQVMRIKWVWFLSFKKLKFEGVILISCPPPKPHLAPPVSRFLILVMFQWMPSGTGRPLSSAVSIDEHETLEMRMLIWGTAELTTVIAAVSSRHGILQTSVIF